MKQVRSFVHFTFAFLLLAVLFVASPFQGARGQLGLAPDAGAPTVVSYQGQVTVSGVPYNGSGYFKFAVVNAAGTVSYWSNDGSSSGGSAPTTPVTLTVNKGLFSVLLGDTTLDGMTRALTPSVFNQTNLYLKVWFSQTSGGSYSEMPLRRFAAAPYALQAANADKLDNQDASDLGQPSGGITLGQPYGSGLLTAGYTALGPSSIKWGGQWSSTDLTNAPAARSAHTAVWTGKEMLVWGGYGSTILGDGAAYNPASDSWTTLPASGLQARAGHSAIWADGRMFIWGGVNGSTYLNDGAIYSPATASWQTMPASPLSGRGGQSAVWTGTQMIVWGGYNGSYLNDGASFDTSTNSWTLLTELNAPSARNGHCAVWTGSAMVIWGGNGTTPYNDGKVYSPGSGGVWYGMNNSDAPKIGSNTCIWSGKEMFVGMFTTYYWFGSRYNPQLDSWTSLPSAGAPSLPGTAVWGGDELIVWGGSMNTETGGRFNPETNTWSSTPSGNTPQGRNGHTAVWTGSEMIIWGGSYSTGMTTVYLNSGGRFSPFVNLYLKP